MKVNSKDLSTMYFITEEAVFKQGNKVFEDYLKSAILELEGSNFLKERESEKVKFLSEKLDFILDLLERISKIPLSSSLSTTVGDFLLSQALEIDKIADSFPEGALKNLFKESALYIGIEGEKLRKGYYTS